jgi:hypothetical protein
VGLLKGGVMPLVCTKLNSKNSFGAYTGIESFAVIFVNGQPANVAPNNVTCAEVRYQPFPELEGRG